LDELNSWLGFCRAAKNGKVKGDIDVAESLRKIQEELFIVQAEIAVLVFEYPSGPKLNPTHREALEALIKRIDTVLPPLTKFIVPGASERSARLDVARTLARRAERRIVALSLAQKVSPDVLSYMNRLSSVIFALARYANHIEGVSEDNPKY
jgi:cob(I)alamin adenosyltransferase